ncbi:MAG TPA: heme-binding protein [Chromatiales bacterium]|nr:heme-binding protein [Chromatiales bacterium]
MNTCRKVATGILIFAVLSLSGVAEEERMTVPIKRLTLEASLRIAQAAISACRKEGVQIAVTVVDRGGHAQVVLRDVLAMDITLMISKQKAHTAMAFNTPLSQLQDRFRTPYQVPKIDGLVLAAGGIPINVGGTILGGIGVSGAPSGEVDEKCATAGLEAVLDDLEMEGM